MKIMNIKFEASEINIKEGVETAKKTAKKIVKNTNAAVLDITEDIVEGSIARGTEWQSVAEKSVKGGLKIAAKQQDMFFDTLDMIKGEYIRNRGRFGKLFSQN